MKKNIITPVILILIGITLLLIPGTILTTVIKIFGLLIMTASIFSFINSFRSNKSSAGLIYSLIMILLSLLFIFSSELIASILPLILGIWIISKSMLKLKMISVLKVNNDKNYMKAFILNIIMLIMGLIILFNPFKGAELFLRIIGIYILIYASLEIIDIYLSKPKEVKVIK